MNGQDVGLGVRRNESKDKRKHRAKEDVDVEDVEEAIDVEAWKGFTVKTLDGGVVVGDVVMDEENEEGEEGVVTDVRNNVGVDFDVDVVVDVDFDDVMDDVWADVAVDDGSNVDFHRHFYFVFFRDLLFPLNLPFSAIVNYVG